MPLETRTTTDVTVTVTRPVALELIKQAGYKQDERGRWGGIYWQLDEALTSALVVIATDEPDEDQVEEAKNRSTCSACLARTYRGEECVCDDGGDAEDYDLIMAGL